jgi:UDP-N-acetylmuramoylalanine-D-glutamate ligase
MDEIMLKEYTSKFKGRKVGFIGCGVSNMPVVELFAAGGVVLSVRDKKENIDNNDRLKQLGVKLILGDKYLENIDEEVLFSPRRYATIFPNWSKRKRKAP